MTGHELLVDRCELRGILGRGGMAAVRDGWDTRLDRPVAVKLLYPALGAVPDVRRRFEDEARSAARLSHQNIVVVFDFGVHERSPFIVLERLPGQTLADPILAGPMPPFRVRAMLDDVLAGLQAAHSAGIVHRDIKPGNILVSASGDCRSGPAGNQSAARTTDSGPIVRAAANSATTWEGADAPPRPGSRQRAVSVRTVEGHLYRVFKQLGISEREQLIRLMRNADPDTPVNG